jgi:hypothetical protein
LITTTKNLASSGEAYYYNYFKLKKVLEENEKPKAVFIEYTNNQLAEEMNDWIWDNKHISQKFVLLSPFIPITETLPLIENNFSGFLNGMALSLKSNFYSVLKNENRNTQQFGGYRVLTNKLTELALNTPRKLNKPSGDDLSQTNLKYLDKMIELCQSLDIKVILIRSPQHKKIQNFKNEKSYQEIRNTRFKELSYLDFKTYPIVDSLFADYSHLNQYGATKISRVLDSLIKTGSLDKQHINLTFD